MNVPPGRDSLLTSRTEPLRRNERGSSCPPGTLYICMFIVTCPPAYYFYYYLYRRPLFDDVRCLRPFTLWRSGLVRGYVGVYSQGTERPRTDRGIKLGMTGHEVHSHCAHLTTQNRKGRSQLGCGTATEFPVYRNNLGSFDRDPFTTNSP